MEHGKIYADFIGQMFRLDDVETCYTIFKLLEFVKGVKEAEKICHNLHSTGSSVLHNYYVTS